MFFERSVAVSPDSLHILAGMFVAAIAAILLRKSLSSPVPLFVTLFAVILNEIGDLLVERWPSPGMQFGEGARDLLLTMAVPMLTYLALRQLPQLFASSRAARDETSGDESCALPAELVKRECEATIGEQLTDVD